MFTDLLRVVAIATLLSVTCLSNFVPAAKPTITRFESRKHRQNLKYWPDPFSLPSKEVTVGIGEKGVSSTARNVRFSLARKSHFDAVVKFNCALRVSLSQDVFVWELERLGCIKTLKIVDLSGRDGVRVASPSFSALATVQHIDLSDTDIDRRALQWISKMQRLESLSVAGCYLECGDLLPITRCKRLTYLDVGFLGPVNSEERQAKVDVASLHELLSQLPAIRALRIQALLLNGTELERLLANNKIERLDISLNPLGSTGIARLGRLTQLRVLRLGGPLGNDRVLGAEIRSWKALDKLVWLDLTGWAVTPDAAEVIAQIPNLDGLTLDASLISKETLRELAKSKSITYLDLSSLRWKPSEFGLMEWPGIDRQGRAFLKTAHLNALAEMSGLTTIITAGNRHIGEKGLDAIQWPASVRIISN